MCEVPAKTSQPPEGDPIQSRLTALSEKLKHFKCNVFIDGPADAGKGTACDFFVKYLGLEKIETGNMYRAVVVWLKRQVNVTNALGGTDYSLYELVESLKDLKIDFHRDPQGTEHILIGRETKMVEVTAEIEADWVNTSISGIAQQDIVRDLVEGWQVQLLKRGNKVIEGRDMWQFMRKRGVRGGLLIYIYATDEELARREVLRKEKMGIQVSFGDARQKITERNRQDNQRKRGQLLTPQAAIEKNTYDGVIDTTGLRPEEVFLRMIEIMESKVAGEKKSL
jgi:cytidylate kinase